MDRRSTVAAIALLVAAALTLDFFVLPVDARPRMATVPTALMAGLYLVALMLGFRFTSWKTIVGIWVAVNACYLSLPAYFYFADAALYDVVLPRRLFGLFLFSVVGVAMIVQKRAGAEIRRLNAELEAKVSARTALHRETTAVALRAQKQLDAITGVVLDGIVVAENGRIVTVNPPFAERLGYAVGDLVGASMLCLIAEHFRQVALDEFRAPGAAPCELLLARRDGSSVLMEAHSAPFRTDGRELCVYGFRDVSERQALQREIVEAGERERRRIGSELRDHLGQLLASMRWLAESLAANSLGTHKTVEKDALKVAALAAECLTECREISQRLAPKPFEGLGLQPMLQFLKQSVENRSAFSCSIHCARTALETDDEIALHLYRIAEEAVANALAHSYGSAISIGFEQVGGHHILSIADDGIGIPAPDQRREGAGLGSMRYRARLIDGLVEVEPGAYGGTTVICTIPVAVSALTGSAGLRSAAG